MGGCLFPCLNALSSQELYTSMPDTESPEAGVFFRRLTDAVAADRLLEKSAYHGIAHPLIKIVVGGE